MEMVVRPCRDVIATMLELMMQSQDALFSVEISTGNRTGLLIANVIRREINLIWLSSVMMM